MRVEINSPMQNSPGVRKQLTDKISGNPQRISTKRKKRVHCDFQKVKRSGFEKLETVVECQQNCRADFSYIWLVKI